MSNDDLSSSGIVPVAVSILSAVSILFAFAVMSRRALGLLSLDRFALGGVWGVMVNTIAPVVFHDIDWAFNQAFDATQVIPLRRVAERECNSFASRAGSTANSMDITFRFVG